MQPSLYVALSGQVALERRMETIAKNVANMSTVGYRAEEVTFETILSDTGRDKVAFATSGESYISRRAGGMTRTGGTLDFAIDGEGWFAIQTPRGVAYTRDGRMTIRPDGALTTLGGYRVLDAGGAPVQVDADGGPITVARDGMMTQRNIQGAALGLFTIPNAAKLTRFENSAVIPDIPAQPVLDFSRNGVAQGYVEAANINPVMEMTRLIMVSRAFESASAAVDEAGRSMGDAIRTLGETS